MPKSFSFDRAASTAGEGFEFSKIRSRMLSGRSEGETCQNPLILIMLRPPLAEPISLSLSESSWAFEASQCNSLDSEPWRMVSLQ